jgi:hypothetical protein
MAGHTPQHYLGRMGNCLGGCSDLASLAQSFALTRVEAVEARIRHGVREL